MAIFNESSQPKEKRIRNFSEVSSGFPQKLALEEARRCPQCADPVCQKGCPLGIDIRGFIRLLREGNAASALEKIKEQNGMPSVCGRICSAPCEIMCILNEDKVPISIRALERYAADNGRMRFVRPTKLTHKGKKVAVIGSGPSGLTAAADLAKLGYQATILESMDQPGGVLRYGIPEFRIPKKILDEEIQHIKSLGVEIKTNVFIGQTTTIKDLLNDGFSAVLLATGAGRPKFMDLPGANLGCVYYGEEFLMRINLMKANFFAKYIPTFVIGKKIVVIGSGNTALDCARSARRLGRDVTLIFRRTEEEMRVRRDECKEAKEEGIKLEPLVKPLEILPDERNFVSGIKCVRMDYAEGNLEGGWDLIPVPDSEFILEADTVIIAIGHEPNVFVQKSLPDLELSEDGSVWVDPENYMTSVSGVFATGNVVTNAGPVVEAMASGKKAAVKIDAFLSGK